MSDYTPYGGFKWLKNADYFDVHSMYYTMVIH